MENGSFAYPIGVALFSMAVSFLLTPLVLSLAKKVGAIDVPRDDRRMHRVPIPRMGGLSVFLGVLLSSFLFDLGSDALYAVFLGGFLILMMGVLDDVFNLPAGIKFLVQITAALTVMLQGISIQAFALPDRMVSLGALSLPLTLLWIVLVTNAVNCIDGLDGLACGICAIVSFSLAFFSFLQSNTANALICSALFGGCVGFLYYNRHPARIFLGDTGSQCLGFFLAVFSLSPLSMGRSASSFSLIPLLLLSLPIGDTAFAFARRILRGKNPFRPDRGHLHHRLTDAGLSQTQTVSLLHTLCLCCAIGALILGISF